MKRKANPLLWFGIGYLGLLALFALIGPNFRHYYMDKVGLPLQPASADFWFGTDDQGRDVFARVAYGARTSLLVGLTVQAVAIALGVLVGVLGVMGKKWVREPLLRITDAMFAFPDILLAILIIGVWPRAAENRVIPVIIALTITSWPGVARLVKNQVATLKDREFAVAATALGASNFYVVTRHIMPHLTGVLLAVGMVDLAGIILAESALSFLGIGVTAPIPSWGNMINDARAHMSSNPILIVWPCLVLSLTIFALNFVGDALRARSDPKSG